MADATSYLKYGSGSTQYFLLATLLNLLICSVLSLSHIYMTNIKQMHTHTHSVGSVPLETLTKLFVPPLVSEVS